MMVIIDETEIIYSLLTSLPSGKQSVIFGSYSVELTRDEPGIVFYRNGKRRHRGSGKPCETWFYSNGSIEMTRYCVSGKCHRDGDKPAEIRFYQNGQLSSEGYYVNGKKHRDGDKPAETWWDRKGNLNGKQYYINGVRLKHL